MTNDQFKLEYQAGKVAFERGRYTLSIKHLETASGMMDYASRWGGETRVWLVTAYHAAHCDEKAIALCNQLKTHPSHKVREQSRRLAEIITAPKLKRPEAWMTKIPDLTNVADSQLENRYVKAAKQQDTLTKQYQIEPEIDLTEVETEDNLFIWAAIGVCTVLGLLYLLFFTG